MSAVLDQLRTSVRHGVPVVILGEAGTGKSTLLRHFQEFLGWADLQVQVVACDEIENGVQAGQLGFRSQLWPNEVVRPTDPDAVSLVTFDDIDRLGAQAQAQLLYWLDEQEQRADTDEPPGHLPCFVSTTRNDIFSDVTSGIFRARLYYRLSGVEVAIPPLRNRPDDVSAIANVWARSEAIRIGKSPPELDTATIELLKHQRWPGNISQLRAVIERSIREVTAELGFCDVLRDELLQSACVDRAKSALFV